MGAPTRKPHCTKALSENREEFRRILCRWFSQEGKDYPWRHSRDPYAILVSEVMLQQTRISTVLERAYYTRFLEAFPTVNALARADDEALLKAWEGLGYYRRARMLKSTAQAVVANHQGKFPNVLDVLLKLPGVGPYTAGALRAFAFELPAVLVDGNVVRVLARLFDEQGDLYSGKGKKKVWECAELLADDKQPRLYHSALMELGQTHCRVGTPDCRDCPVASFCKSREPETLPQKKPRRKVEELEESAVWIRDSRGRVLLHRESGTRRTGLWKLPLREMEEIQSYPVVSRSTYAITRFKVHLVVRDLGCVSGKNPVREGDRWFAPEEIESLPMATPFRRVLEKLLHDF